MEVNLDGSNELRTLFKKLKLPSKTASIVVEYSGSGDSGDMDYIELLDKKGEPVKLKDPEDLGWELIEIFTKEHRGWENNDGAKGKIEINLLESTFNHRHTTFFTSEDVEETSGEF